MLVHEVCHFDWVAVRIGHVPCLAEQVWEPRFITVDDLQLLLPDLVLVLTSLRWPQHAFWTKHEHVFVVHLGMETGLFSAARDAVILHILRYGFLDLVLLTDLHLAAIRWDALSFERFLRWSYRLLSSRACERSNSTAKLRLLMKVWALIKLLRGSWWFASGLLFSDFLRCRCDVRLIGHVILLIWLVGLVGPLGADLNITT